MGKTRVNWILAQQEYLASKEASLSDIARKYCVSLSRVKKVSMKNRWSETKKRVWEKARELAINESVDSAKEMIKRQSETARYFQEKGLELLKQCLELIKPEKLQISTMVRMLVLGLRTERELYSEELKRYNSKITYEPISEGLSRAVTEAINESLTKYPSKLSL